MMPIDGSHLEHKIARVQRFFGERGRGKLLLQVQVEGQGLATPQILPEHMSAGWRPYIAAKAGEFAAFAASRQWLDDDWFPVLHPWFGAAELVAYLPNRVEFGAETCWTIPEIKSAAQFQPPPFDPGAPLLRLHLDVLHCCRDLAHGRFLVGLRGTYAPLEVASTVVGSDFFYDLVDRPQDAQRLLAYGVEGATWHLEQQLGVVGMHAGGTVNGYLQLWMPGRVAGHVGNDFACLLSPDMYRRFGQPADAAVGAHFDLMQMHTHNLGWHQFPSFVAIPKMGMLEIAEDPNVTPTSERLPELFALVGETPVVLYMGVRAFRKHLGALALGNALVRLTEPVGQAEALELLELARRHSSPPRFSSCEEEWLAVPWDTSYGL